MYVTNHRLAQRGTLTSLTSKPLAVSPGIDTVYSFRTGKGQRGQVATAYKPAGATIAQKLASRKEFLEGVDRSSSYDGAPITYTQGRTNAFVRTKTRYHGSASQEIWYRGTQLLAKDAGPFTGAVYHPAGAHTGLPSGYAGFTIGSQTLLPTFTEAQNYGSRMHAALSPFKAQAGIGETLMELMSGNVPKLTSKLYKSLTDGTFLNALKRAPKNASQDYLNTQFGLGPILSDLYQILVEGVMLHDAIYGRSFRRSARSLKEQRVTYGTPSLAIGGYTIDNKNAVRWNSTSLFKPGSLTSTDVQTFDMRFTARFTLARASEAANGRYDRALDLIRSYGMWTPSLLWDLAPWSFVFDWFLNLGRGINNAYDFGKDGGLNSDYACVTARTFASRSNEGYEHISGTSSQTRITRCTSMFMFTDTIQRFPVNPFGNYATLGQMSGWQQGILLALGIARTK